MCKSKDGPLGTRLAGPIAMLKFQTTRMAWDVADHCVQIMGGRGITRSGMGAKVEGFKNCTVARPDNRRAIGTPSLPPHRTLPHSGVIATRNTLHTVTPLNQARSLGSCTSVVLSFLPQQTSSTPPSTADQKRSWPTSPSSRRLRTTQRMLGCDVTNLRAFDFFYRLLDRGKSFTDPVGATWEPFNHKHHKTLKTLKNNTTAGVVRAC